MVCKNGIQRIAPRQVATLVARPGTKNRDQDDFSQPEATPGVLFKEPKNPRTAQFLTKILNRI